MRPLASARAAPSIDASAMTATRIATNTAQSHSPVRVGRTCSSAATRRKREQRPCTAPVIATSTSSPATIASAGSQRMPPAISVARVAMPIATIASGTGSMRRAAADRHRSCRATRSTSPAAITTPSTASQSMLIAPSISITGDG